MAEDEMADRIRRLEDEIAEIKAVKGAEEALREDAARGIPIGLVRLRNVKRNEDYPTTEGEER